MEEKKIGQTREIDIIGALRKIWSQKRLLALYTGGFAILGICVALVNPKEYKSEVVLAPEMNSGGLGLSESLSNMASTFGIDLGSKSSMDAIYPEIYPTVVASNDFIIPLLETKVYLKNDTTLRTYRNHLANDTRSGFWSYPMGWIRSLFTKEQEATSIDINPTRLTVYEENLVNAVRGSISCIIDIKTRIITIGFKDQDPQVAAILADTIQSRLRAYITTYRTCKASNDLEYYQKLLEKSKEEYLKSQRRYSEFCDAHTNTILTSYQAKKDELENEMQTNFNIYTQMHTQVQQAKAKVQQDTPAYTIIQQATVPNRASSTPRSIIVLMYTIFGAVLASVWILFFQNHVKLKNPFRK